MDVVICPYCNQPAELVNGTVIYPHAPYLATKLFYLCRDCKAYVGCHPNSESPLGTLANAETREARKRAHSAFDPTWKRKGTSRTKAYKRLANFLGIPRDQCHIGMFTAEQCERVIEFCKR